MFETKRIEGLESLKREMKVPEGYSRELAFRIYGKMIPYILYDETIEKYIKGFLVQCCIYERVKDIVGDKPLSNNMTSEKWEEILKDCF